MARYGFLYCATCKEEIFLGKWLQEADRGIGFWHGQLCPEGVPMRRPSVARSCGLSPGTWTMT